LKILSLFLFSLYPVFFPLAPIEAGPLNRPFTFHHFTVKDGLSSEMVYAVAVQGEEVWFGTYGGGATLLNRVQKTSMIYTTKGEPKEKDDGVSIKWKNHPAYNHVWVILPERNRIWFGTYFYGFGGGGISYYQPARKNPWRKFDTNQSRAKKVVSLAADGDRLWVGSEKGLSVLDKKTERWKSFYTVEDGLAGNFVNALLLDQDFLWIGTNAGMTRMSISQNTLKTYNPKEGIAAGLEIKSIVKVKNQIWAGTPGGALLAYDPKRDQWKAMEAPDPLKDGGIHSISVARGFVFICRDNGVSVYDLASGQWGKITQADGLLSNTVFSAAEDRDGIWFGTDQGASLLLLKP
jgi:ligand-binding sensor domain-containing protein